MYSNDGTKSGNNESSYQRLQVSDQPTQQQEVSNHQRIPSESSILGMISHKMSRRTIFGHNHNRQKFHQKYEIFHKKNSTPSILVYICYQIKIINEF